MEIPIAARSWAGFKMSSSSKIRMRNCPVDQRVELRSALDFYIQTLLGPKLSQHIQTQVLFVHDLRRKERRRGDACWIRSGVERRPRTFRVRVDADIGLRAKLLVLAHEAAHIKHFARGELKGLGTDRTLWNGHPVACKSISYWDYPWEIEARGMELSLYVKWKAHKKKLMRENT